jgi:hypothetical protein
MWNRIDNTGIDGEERIELVRNVDTLSLCPQEEYLPVACEGVRSAPNFDKCGKFVHTERPLDHSPRLNSNGFYKCLAAKGKNAKHLNKLRRLQPGNDITWLYVWSGVEVGGHFIGLQLGSPCVDRVIDPIVRAEEPGE